MTTTRKSSWKSSALQKQLDHKRERNLSKSGTHGAKLYLHILHDDDAADGAQFYCYKTPEWEHLQEWANQRRKVNFKSNSLKNMLRSEHIAYAVSYPLEKIRREENYKLCALFDQIINEQLKEVTSVSVEFAGNYQKSQLLNDNTSFDIFIECTTKDYKNCAIGIELKYTEKSYPYGKTEKDRLYDEGSSYLKTARDSGYFINHSNASLKSKKLKQAFRNHLLGIKMELIAKDKNTSDNIDIFYSVHMYPSGNTYQGEVVSDYRNELKEEYKSRYIGLTYEDFIDYAREVGISGKWLDYFEMRYIAPF